MAHFKEFKSFREASAFAKRQAALNGSSVQLVRTTNSWKVSLPVVAEDSKVEYEAADDDVEPERDIEPEELLRDIADDAYDYARSEEDGWFYNDNEGSDDRNTGHPGDGWYHDTVLGWFHYDSDE